MYSMKKQILLFAIFSAAFSSVDGQSWTNFNESNSGIYSNGTYGIAEDIYNNIWIGLGTGSLQGNGLDKFDGINWTHYDTINSSLPQNMVRAIKGDAYGNIWLNYWGGASGTYVGLTKFDGANWTVYDTTYSPLLMNQTIDIQSDKENNIWVSCLGGLVKYDGTTFTNYFQSHWGFLAVQDSANIWRGANLGLDHLNPLTGVWTHYDPSNSNIPSYGVAGLALDTNGLLWMSFSWYFDTGSGITNGGIATFDGTTFTPIWPFQNASTYSGDLIVDNNNNVWVMTSGEGIYKFDGITWTQVNGTPAGYGKLFADHQNNIWASTFYNGIWTNRQTVGISQPVVINEEKLFPNPASNIVTISLLNSRNVKVLNLHGEIVIENNFSSNSIGRVELDVSFLSSGMYFIHVGSEVQKFVKE